MIKDFFKLSIVLVLGFAIWIFYEKSLWTHDYSQYKAEAVSLGPLDQTYLSNIVPKLFENAQVITDKERLRHPEDLAVANDGTIYTGLRDGRIAVINSTGNIDQFYVFNTSGQILGIILTSDESTLYFVTQFEGLIKLDIATKTPTYLFKELDGVKLQALNNLCIDEENQIIYITHATNISMKFANKEALLKHRKGRILAYHLNTKKIDIVLAGLAFPNGIVYQKSTSSIIFSELNRHRIVRYYVGGQRKGQTEYIIENLFGFGDNLKLNEKGELLVAIPSTRDGLLEYLNDKPELRQLIMYLPERVIYFIVKKVAGGIKIDTKTGKILEYYFAGAVKTYFVTTIVEKNNKLYFGSLLSPTIIVLDKTVSTQPAATSEL